MVEAKRPDSFLIVANHRFGRILGSKITSHFSRHPLIFAQGPNRFVVHLLEDPSNQDRTAVVMQRPQSYRKEGDEEFRIGYVSGKHYEERLSVREKDEFFERLSAVIADSATITYPLELGPRLLAENPFLAEF